MTPFAAVAGGGAAGLIGAALAHVVTTLADRLGAENWLRGPYGPQFVPIALYTGVFYAAIGGAAGLRTQEPGRRAATALLGLLIPLLGICLPMEALEHVSGWGMGTVAFIYTAAVWGTIASIGAASAAAPRWRGALAAVLGSLAAYGVLMLCLWAAPSYAQIRWSPTSLLPSPINLLDGLLSGAGLCLALSIDAKIRRNA